MSSEGLELHQEKGVTAGRRQLCSAFINISLFHVDGATLSQDSRRRTNW